jgi:thiol-disulfide isomerase/thioredoxin
VVLAGSLILVGGGLYGISRNIAGLPAPRAAENPLPMAPAFSLPDLDARTRALGEFLGKKPILLEFMDLDCPHCLEMAPILTRLHGAYESRVQFLTVAFERRRDPRRVRTFAEKHRHSWPYLLGNQDVVQAYRLQGVPSFFLVRSDGRIAGFLEGSASYEAMFQGLEAFLVGR